jgi:hypothetical protein
MKTYTEDEVESLVRKVISETAQAVRDWFEFETQIQDIETKINLPNAEIDLRPNAKDLDDYIYPRLEEKDIITLDRD